MEFEEHYKNYLKLLKSPSIQTLLNKDKHGIVADKYHLAIVLIFFIRANFSHVEYNPSNFHTALYLSHEIYEDISHFKDFIVLSMFGWNSHRFQEKLYVGSWKLMVRLNCKVFVDGEVCEELFRRVPNEIWGRERCPAHSGVVRDHGRCLVCMEYYRNFENLT